MLPEEVHFELSTKDLEKGNLEFRALYQFRLFDVINATDSFEKYDSSHKRGIIFNVYNLLKGDCGSTVVKVLRYKSEGRWFDFRWCHGIFH
jgi:hypothetical protein